MLTSKEKSDTRRLPMMPIRDVVIFPYMMTPFVVGRESSVRALEEALAGDKKIFLATQHDASVDEPKPSEIYQVGTIVNIVQSLKLPDGNIKVLVEGVERGKILQVTETEGYMQATVRVVRYTAEPNAQLEAGMQRVTALFEQYVKRSEEHTSELQSHVNHVCRLLLDATAYTDLYTLSYTTLFRSKLPDGNIKVLVEGVERGKILQVTETEGFMQATVRVVRYTAEPNAQLEAGMQRVTALFEQYVK